MASPNGSTRDFLKTNGAASIFQSYDSFVQVCRVHPKTIFIDIGGNEEFWW